jgi:hypothetical protein
MYKAPYHQTQAALPPDWKGGVQVWPGLMTENKGLGITLEGPRACIVFGSGRNCVAMNTDPSRESPLLRGSMLAER